MVLVGYLLRLFLPTFLASLGVLTFVAFMGQFVKIFNMALVKGIPFAWVGQCFLLILPQFLGSTLPIAFLVALMLSLGQLAENGELLALRASGFSSRQVLWPFAAFAVLLVALLLWVHHAAAPTAWNAFENRFAAAASKVASVDPEPRTFLTLGEWKLFAETVDRRGGALGGVHLFRYRGESMSMIVTAERGRYRLERGAGFHLTLLDGELARPSRDDPTRIVRASFSEYSVFVPFGADVARRQPIPTELTTAAILDEHRRSPRSPRRWELMTEAGRRTAMAVAPLLFFWAAWPVGLRLEKKGRAAGLLYGLAVIFGFFGLCVLGVSLGRKGELLSYAAPYIGDLGCFFLGAVLVWRR